MTEMSWMDVSGWVSDGGAQIGTNRYVPSGSAIAQIAKQVAAHQIDGLLMAGGWAGYQATHELPPKKTGSTTRPWISRSSVCR